MAKKNASYHLTIQGCHKPLVSLKKKCSVYEVQSSEAMKGGLPVLGCGVTGGPGGKRGHGGASLCGPCRSRPGLLGETPSLWTRPSPWASL